MDFSGSKVIGMDQLIKNLKGKYTTLEQPEFKRFIAEKVMKVILEISNSIVSKADITTTSSNFSEYKKHHKFEYTEYGIRFYNDVQGESGHYYSLEVEVGSGEYGAVPLSSTDAQNGYYSVGSRTSRYEPDRSSRGIKNKNGSEVAKTKGQRPQEVYYRTVQIIEQRKQRWIREYLKKYGGNK